MGILFHARPLLDTIFLMRRSIPARLLGTAQLTRLAMAVGAVGDVWFTVLFSRGQEQYSFLPVYKLPIGITLFCTALVATGIFTFGASLNDLLDARHDSTFSPDRPIPSGRIKPATVGIVIAGALIAAILGAIPLGTGALILTLIVAGGVLFYNATGKHVPAIGVIVIGVMTALHMLIPNYEMTFTLPIWLTMSHMVTITLAIHILERKRPYLSRRSYVFILIGYAIWSTLILLVGWMQGQDAGWWPKNSSPLGVIWPILVVALFAWVARRKITGVSTQSGAEKLARYGAMWQCLYGAAWLVAVGIYDGALLLGILAFLGFTGMTLIKEVGSLITAPPQYRI